MLKLIRILILEIINNVELAEPRPIHFLEKKSFKITVESGTRASELNLTKKLKRKVE